MSHVEHLLAEYHDQELPERLRRQVETHLEECAECRAELSRLEGLSDLLDAYTLPDAFASAEVFRAQVTLRLSRRSRPQVRYLSWSWHVVPIVLVSALVGLLGLVVLIDLVQSAWAVFEWAGIDVATVLGVPRLVCTGTWLEELVCAGMQGLGGLAFRLCLYTVALVLFGSFVGWIGVLWRADARPFSLKEG